MHARDGRAATVLDDRSRAVGAADITMVLCVRCHPGNPWVLTRLDWMAEHYTPCPPVLIVDLGSEPAFAGSLAALCKRRGYQLVAVDDAGLFSLARARNIGFEHVETDFVFFCDPDFFGERDLFQRLAAAADALQMRSVVDIVLNLPAVHLPMEQTQEFEQLSDPEQRCRLLRQWAWMRNYAAFAKGEDTYVAPYSNVFMIHRSMFLMAGGYDESFRGHGSEDFEFLLRLVMHAAHLPLPAARTSDLYGPHSEDFFHARPYAGFRRILELMAQPTESLGLKVFHLWHERSAKSDWYRHKDRGRNRFKAAIAHFAERPHALLGIDHLGKPLQLLCCCPDPDDWRLFVPLRLAGFRLQAVFGRDPQARASMQESIRDPNIDNVAVLCWDDNDAAFAQLAAFAKRLGKRVLTISPGAQPGSLIYSDSDSPAATDNANMVSTYCQLSQPPASRDNGPVQVVRAVTAFRWQGELHVLDRLARTLPFSWNSYAAARIAARRTPAAMIQQVRRDVRDGVMLLPRTVKRWLKANKPKADQE